MTPLATLALVPAAAWPLVPTRAAEAGGLVDLLRARGRAGWRRCSPPARASPERQGGQEFVLGPWYATAPLPAKTFAEVLFPERGIDLAAKDDDGAEALEEAREVRRRRRARPAAARPRLYLPLPRRSRAERAAPRTASFGSDDGIEVWLNGEKLLSRDVPARAGARPGPRRAAARGRREPPAAEDPQQRRRARLLLLAAQSEVAHALGRGSRRDFPRECAWFRRDLPGTATSAGSARAAEPRRAASWSPAC